MVFRSTTGALLAACLWSPGCLWEKGGPSGPAPSDSAKSQPASRRSKVLGLQTRSAIPAKKIGDPSGLARAKRRMAEGRIYDAVEDLQAWWEASPGDVQRRTMLAGLQNHTGLQHQAIEHFRWLIQRGHHQSGELLVLADTSRPQTDRQTLRQARRLNPADLRPEYGLAMDDAYAGKWEEVKSRLQAVWKQHPQFVPAKRLGYRAAAELEDPSLDEQISADWSEQVPVLVSEHPDFWLAIALWFQHYGQPESQIAALREAIRRSPNHPDAHQRLARVLAENNQAELADQVLRRLRLLTDLRDRVDAFGSWQQNSQIDCVRIAESMYGLGRRWEALCWLRQGSTMSNRPSDKLRTRFAEYRKGVTATTPWQDPRSTLIDVIPAADMTPRDALERLGTLRNRGRGLAKDEIDTARPVSMPPGNPSETTPIDFSNVALETGLIHDSAMSFPDDSREGLWIWQSGVGGAAVLDFDRDGWPDLALSRVGGTPGLADSQPNVLFRNRDGRWQLADRAGAGDPGYTQGLAVGDLNADGFDDLLVANIGSNRWLRNNGDGTFSEFPQSARDFHTPAATNRTIWTSSIGVGDLNGDGLADVYEVQYVGGDAALTQRCPEPAVGGYRSCQPLVFDAEADNVWLAQKEGDFKRVGGASGDGAQSTAIQAGRGLGIILGQLDAKGGIEAYVANDMTGNHWVTWDEQSGQLVDSALLRGVALNRGSLAQASMGIAADDFDQDGDIDLFVTHFSNDHNTLYEQRRGGFFCDRSQAAGIVTPSMPLLGFGAQPIDWDGDGRSEILVANGHIDDFTHKSEAFEMPAQLLRVTAGGRWVDAKVCGDAAQLLQKNRLARSIAKLDFNRDGQWDAVMTDLRNPTELWENRVKVPNQPIAVHCVGTASERSAVGTTITMIRDGDLPTIRQAVLSGDGYQASNQRVYIFPAAADASSIRLDVQWSSGLKESFELDTRIGQWLLVEAQPAWPLGKD
ncbi:MAG: FG-GAP-like repeat-containing protein [Planctomycetota bacterium]